MRSKLIQDYIPTGILCDEYILTVCVADLIVKMYSVKQLYSTVNKEQLMKHINTLYGIYEQSLWAEIWEPFRKHRKKHGMDELIKYEDWCPDDIMMVACYYVRNNQEELHQLIEKKIESEIGWYKIIAEFALIFCEIQIFDCQYIDEKVSFFEFTHPDRFYFLLFKYWRLYHQYIFLVATHEEFHMMLWHARLVLNLENRIEHCIKRVESKELKEIFDRLKSFDATNHTCYPKKWQQYSINEICSEFVKEFEILRMQKGTLHFGLMDTEKTFIAFCETTFKQVKKHFKRGETDKIPIHYNPNLLSLDTPPVFAHSPDFASFNYMGKLYEFTKMQAQVMQVLFEVHKQGAPVVGQHYILEQIESPNKRLRDIFKDSDGLVHPAWNKLITPGDKQGTFQLNLP